MFSGQVRQHRQTENHQHTHLFRPNTTGMILKMSFWHENVTSWHEQLSNCFRLMLDGKMLLSCGDWDASFSLTAIQSSTYLKLYRKFYDHYFTVSCMATDDTFLATGSNDGCVMVICVRCSCVNLTCVRYGRSVRHPLPVVRVWHPYTVYKDTPAPSLVWTFTPTRTRLSLGLKTEHVDFTPSQKQNSHGGSVMTVTSQKRSVCTSFYLFVMTKIFFFVSDT